MKLIVVLLTLLCVARLAHCVPTDLSKQEAYNMANQDPAYLIFSDGFQKDGTLVTFFYKYKENIQPKDGKVYINFYGDPELTPNVLTTGKDVNGKHPEIIAHISIQPNSIPTVKTDTFMKKAAGDAAWQAIGSSCCTTDIPLVGTGTKKDWFRVDIYKFDPTHLGVFVQGKWFQNHEFTLKPLNEIKSAYIFNSIDTNDVYIKYRIPGLVTETPLAKFNDLVKDTMKPLPVSGKVSAKREALPAATDVIHKDTEFTKETSVHAVKFSKFEKNAKIFITAWMGSREPTQKEWMRPRIQIRHADENMLQHRVFSIYHDWVSAGKRKSYIDVTKYIHKQTEVCHEDVKKACEPVYCVGAESTSDLEHYRIERIGEKEIEVTTYYAEADPINGVMGKTCKTSAAQSAKLVPNDLDFTKGFQIVGLNGAMILHADMQ